MPDLIYSTMKVDVPENVMKLYRNVEDDFISNIPDSEEYVVAPSAAVAGVKCRQIANGAVYDEEHNWHDLYPGKLEALADLVEELSGSPLLVLYEFEHDRTRIQSVLGQSAQVLGSGLSSRQAETLIDRFNNGEISVLLGHPASMGHGLNLQGSCHHIAWFGIPWNLEHYLQAIARVYRQGQKSRSIFVYNIVASGTVDERVVKVLQSKDADQISLLKALSTHRREVLEGV